MIRWLSLLFDTSNFAAFIRPWHRTSLSDISAGMAPNAVERCRRSGDILQMLAARRAVPRRVSLCHQQRMLLQG